MSTPAPLKFLFVINPISGGKMKDSRENAIREYFVTSPHTAEIFLLDGKNDAASLDYWIERIKPDRVVAVGGDGTVNLVAKKIMGTQMIMGIIPAGSANGLATELGMPNNTEAALEIIINGEAKDYDVLKINDLHISLHLADVGLNAQLIKYFEESNWRGKLGYAKVLLKTLWKKQKLTVNIETPDQNISRKAFMVVLANSRTYGTGAVINPDGNLRDGKFEIVIVRRLALSELLKMIIFHKPFNPKKVEVISTKSAIIKTKNKSYLQADGEYLGKEKFIKATMAVEKVRLIHPA
ncbi:MAG TPA: diacylglycerol kinase family protein [Chitinophagaceae bacterium]|nr:diacylglycerol kinase family protein [Chitinophagaceae bacterium]